MEPGTVDVAREGRVAVVTLNRPPVNAMSVALAAKVRAAVNALTADDGVRAIVVTGAGDRAFCAGGDIAEFATLKNEEILDAVRGGQRMLWDVEHARSPVLAAVNGSCLGAGSGLAMACDVRIASESAVFGHPETSLGLTLAYANSARLARLVGPAKAKELMFTARRISAEEALAIGLVNAVVPHAQVLERARAMASEIAANSPDAVRAAKLALEEAMEKPYSASPAIEARHLSEVLKAGGIQEGLRAFLEKREPKWRSSS